MNSVRSLIDNYIKIFNRQIIQNDENLFVLIVFGVILVCIILFFIIIGLSGRKGEAARAEKEQRDFEKREKKLEKMKKELESNQKKLEQDRNKAQKKNGK